MKKSLFSIVTASLLLTGISVASAQTTTNTTTSWTNEQGTVIHEYSTSKKYGSYSEPAWKAEIGSELPSKVTIYPLPETMKIMPVDRYSYGIVNEHPIIVERTTRRVVHSWE